MQAKYRRIVMEKQWMSLYTAELDKLETILLEWLYSHQGKESSENRFFCRKILDAIREKDEAWLVY